MKIILQLVINEDFLFTHTLNKCSILFSLFDLFIFIFAWSKVLNLIKFLRWNKFGRFICHIINLVYYFQRLLVYLLKWEWESEIYYRLEFYIKYLMEWHINHDLINNFPPKQKEVTFALTF